MIDDRYDLLFRFGILFYVDIPFLSLFIKFFFVRILPYNRCLRFIYKFFYNFLYFLFCRFVFYS